MLVASALLLATLPGTAQRNQERGPRAIAVAEFAKTTPAGALAPPVKVFPVTILWQGAYRNAALFQASPVPLALEAGTVYEVQHSGKSLGLLTLTRAGENNDFWLAIGSWEPASASGASAAKSKPAPAGEDDERPILKREQQIAAPASEAAGPASNTAGAASQSAAPGTASPGVEAAPAENSAPSPSAPAYNAEERDPGRPLLRRGRPQPQASDEVFSEAPPSGAAESSAKRAEPPVTLAQARATAIAREKFLVAVSDATTTDERSYDFPWTPAEQARLTKEVERIALQASQRYEREHKLPVAAGWQQTQVRAFDLFSDNDAEIVLTGTQQVNRPRARQIFVTYAAFLDSSGELNEIFSELTDSDHLDVNGRLQLIDAVDSTGDGRGDLLFRRLGRDSQSFELYRFTGTQLWPLFTGGEIPF